MHNPARDIDLIELMLKKRTEADGYTTSIILTVTELNEIGFSSPEDMENKLTSLTEERVDVEKITHNIVSKYEKKENEYTIFGTSTVNLNIFLKKIKEDYGLSQFKINRNIVVYKEQSEKMFNTKNGSFSNNPKFILFNLLIKHFNKLVSYQKLFDSISHLPSQKISRAKIHSVKQDQRKIVQDCISDLQERLRKKFKLKSSTVIIKNEENTDMNKGGYTLIS